jgi:hypothetical protein
MNEESRLNQLKEKIRKWKQEGYNVDELESKIKDVKIQTSQIEVKSSIPSVRKPKYEYILGAIALFVIIAVIAFGIYRVYFEDFNTGEDVWNEESISAVDTDGDGVGDNTDTFPNDSTQWADTDNDGYGDNLTGNNPDAFIYDSSEWKDSDNDGVGNNKDDFPYDESETIDTDKDGYGDNSDDFPSDIKLHEKKAIFGEANLEGNWTFNRSHGEGFGGDVESDYQYVIVRWEVIDPHFDSLSQAQRDKIYLTIENKKIVNQYRFSDSDNWYLTFPVTYENWGEWSFIWRCDKDFDWPEFKVHWEVYQAK